MIPFKSRDVSKFLLPVRTKQAPPVWAYMTIPFETMFQCVCICMYTHIVACVWKSGDNFGTKLAVCGIGRLRLPDSHSECLDLLNHLGDPIIPFFKKKLIVLDLFIFLWVGMFCLHVSVCATWVPEEFQRGHQIPWY